MQVNEGTAFGNLANDVAAVAEKRFIISASLDEAGRKLVHASNAQDMRAEVASAGQALQQSAGTEEGTADQLVNISKRLREMENR